MRAQGTHQMVVLIIMEIARPRLEVAVSIVAVAPVTRGLETRIIVSYGFSITFFEAIL